MTEKEYEIQNLRRENALLKKSRDLFKEQFYTEARKNEKLKTERDAAIGDLKEHGDCELCKHSKVDGESEWYTETCLHCGWFPWNDIEEEKTLWEWRGVQDDKL